MHVFKRERKTGSDGADVTCYGRLFQVRTAATGARSPYVESRVRYGEQTVRETKRNADAFETPTLLDGEVRQRGMTVPGHEDICKPACNLSAVELSASVHGVGAA